MYSFVISITTLEIIKLIITDKYASQEKIYYDYFKNKTKLLKAIANIYI